MERFINSLVIMILFVFSHYGYGDLNKIMSENFEIMLSAKDPKMYGDEIRTNFYGGEAHIKVPIVKTDSIIDFEPPSINAGCGGLDFYGGSFSFISEAKFGELLRSIASNSAGYLVEVALDSMCPTCVAVMKDLRSAMQAMNETMEDSCLAAKSLTKLIGAEKAVKNIGDEIGSKVSEVVVNRGYTDDSFSAMIKGLGDNLSKLNDHDELKLVTGNILFDILKNSKLERLFVASLDLSKNKELYEPFQSIFGTVVTSYSKKENADGKIKVEPIYPTITVDDLINGGKLTLLSCYSGDNCVEIKRKSFKLKGYKSRVSELLLGNGRSIGIIEKVLNSTMEFTDEEKRFIVADPMKTVSLIIKTARDPYAARQLARDSAYVISLLLTSDFINSLKQALDLALNKEKDKPGFDAMRHMIKRNYDKAMADLARNYTESIFVLKKAEQYEDLVKSLPAKLS